MPLRLDDLELLDRLDVAGRDDLLTFFFAGGLALATSVMALIAPTTNRMAHIIRPTLIHRAVFIKPSSKSCTINHEICDT